MFRLLFASLILAVVILAAPNPTFADKEEWKPVDPAQLMMKSPVVEKDADAEALFWEIKVEDEVEGSTPRTVLSNYIRIKIFTERGRESQSKIEIKYAKGDKVTDIAGRTIKADGSILELKKDSIFERNLVKVGGKKIDAKTFAMPGVEPGA